MSEETLRSQILIELRQINATLIKVLEVVTSRSQIRGSGIYDAMRARQRTSYRSKTDPSTLTPDQLERIARITKQWDNEVIHYNNIEEQRHIVTDGDNPISTGVQTYS